LTDFKKAAFTSIIVYCGLSGINTSIGKGVALKMVTKELVFMMEIGERFTNLISYAQTRF
jgi:hypothetical protein